MVDIDWSQIENVPPSRIKQGDILLVVSVLKLEDSHHKGVWGDVTGIQLFPKDSQCPHKKGTIHEFDAYHFVCDIYDEKGAQLDAETFCFPMFFTAHHADTGKPLGPVMPVYVERSKQK